MTSIITDRKFLIKSPNEILHDKIEELIIEHRQNPFDIREIKKEVIPEKILMINEPIKTQIILPKKEIPKNKKYFIPKYYI